MSAVVRKSKREEILSCFTEMVAERGYDEVSVRDVAEALEISKGTVLHHFGNKESLLEELHSEYMRRRIAEAEALLSRFPEPVDQLQLIVYQLMIAQRDDRAATVAFAREIVRFASEEVMADVRAMRDRYSEMVTDVIRRGIESGAFEDVDPRLAALQLFGMCNWSWTWFKPKGRLSAIEIAGQYCRVLLGGLMREAPADLDGRALAEAVVETMSSGEVAAPAGA
ncbi:MAG TPA: TetR/AcrR family transcriptional regulator [Solirubrobacterales bacterium]